MQVNGFNLHKNFNGRLHYKLFAIITCMVWTEPYASFIIRMQVLGVEMIAFGRSIFMRLRRTEQIEVWADFIFDYCRRKEFCNSKKKCYAIWNLQYNLLNSLFYVEGK